MAGAVAIAIGAATLFGFFQLAGGSLLPVSALVKGHYADRLSLGAFDNWSLVLFPLRIPGANLLNVLGIVAMFASLATLLQDARRDRPRQDRAALRSSAIALGSGGHHSFDSLRSGCFATTTSGICLPPSYIGRSCSHSFSVDVMASQ